MPRPNKNINTSKHPSYSSDEYFSKSQIPQKNDLQFISLSDARTKKQNSNRDKLILNEINQSQYLSFNDNSGKNFRF
jgi:hypothetical protein